MVGIAVAAFIIYLIFRIAFIYLRAINEALDMTQ
jgi:hypothetical protein